MLTITPDLLESILDAADVKARLRKDLRVSLDQVDVWDEMEFLAISNRAGDKGVLIIESQNKIYATSYELSRRLFDKRSGKSRPIICDLCCTWQAGSRAGKIRFIRSADRHAITFLCCADLACSHHVRSKTPASRLSRSQLHEDLTNEQRVDRLKMRLSRIVRKLELHE